MTPRIPVEHPYPGFFCAGCGAALTEVDFYMLGLREPEVGETREEYAEAELIDTILHEACAESRRTR